LQDELNEKSAIIDFNEHNDWAKNAYTLTPMPKTRRNWQSIFATALDDLTTLLAPKRIIYCEGRDKPANAVEERGMDAQVFNAIFGAEYPDTLFVSSGGNTELDQRSNIAISIIGKVLPKTEIWVLKDRDMASGKIVTENDRQEYLRCNTDNHRILNRFELENYLFDKEVLQAYCSAQGRALDVAKYNNLELDLANGDIKSYCGAIKTACGVVGSINIDKFKIELAKAVTQDMVIYSELKEVIFNRR
jgi:hypothetical protein